MGTSGAYGGSGSQSWGDAHDAVTTLPATGTPTPTQVATAVKQIADAVHRLFPAPRTATTYDYDPGTLLGRRTTAAGSPTSGQTRRTGGGMSSANAARGGAAVWAGHAALSGSQADLDALGVGLRLEDMRDMSANDRCTYILDKVLGAPGTPDDEALRRAALEALKELALDPTRSPEASITAFMSAYIYQTALVELTSHKASLKLTPDQVLKHEKALKQYIRGTAKYSGVIDGPQIGVRGLMNKVAEFRDKALGWLRKVIG
jgi:hypothetical protein